MDDSPKKNRPPSKALKYTRKLRKNSRRTNPSNDNRTTYISTDPTANNVENDLLNFMIEEFTSDIDDPRVPSTPSILPSTTTTESKSSSRRKSVGEYRRDRLTKHIKNLYQDWYEFDRNSTTQDNIIANAEKRKLYFTSLWYELKTFFNGQNSLDEQGIEIERNSIDRQRKKSLDEFYKFFEQCDFERAYHHNSPMIQRRHLCEYHISHCRHIENEMKDLFIKWDAILALFPSQSALEQFDKRFNPRTKEGGIFYEKLSIFQAWFNLHSEIDRLINVLGKIMTCTQCHTWPYGTYSMINKSHENFSRPPTPSSTSSNEQKESSIDFSPNSINPLETKTKRQNTLSSMPSMDNIYQQQLTPSSTLMDYYYR